MIALEQDRVIEIRSLHTSRLNKIEVNWFSQIAHRPIGTMLKVNIYCLKANTHQDSIGILK